MLICLLAFSVNLSTMYQRLERRKKQEQVVIYFYFVLFVLNVTFVYNGLKQSLIQQTKPNRLICRFLSFLEFLGLFLNSILCCMFRLRYEFSALFVTFVSISRFDSQIYVNLTRETFVVSREKKRTKVVHFLKTMMYNSSIF